MYDTYGHDGPTAGGFGGGYSSYGEGFSGFDFSGFSGGDFFGDVFSSFFGGARSEDPTAPKKGDDLKLQISISFKEAFLGTKKEVKYIKEENCETCDGSGAKKGSNPKTCSHCSGKGKTVQVSQTIFGATRMETICSHCSGKGKEITDKCEDCLGNGRVRKERKITVNIPKGVDDRKYNYTKI